MKSSIFRCQPITLFTLFLCFSLISKVLNAQIANDSLYQQGTIYLQLLESSQVELVLNSHSSDPSTQAIYDIFDNYNVTQIDLPFQLLPSSYFDYAYQIYFSSGNAEDLIADLSDIGIVEFAERVPLCRFDPNTPDDPSVQSGAHPGERSYQLELIQLFDAFDIHTGNGALVAIIDNAFYKDHEDLDFAITYDYTDGGFDTNPPYSSDANERKYWSHGTHVSGIAGARTNNSTGVASPGWNNKLMGIKITPDDGDPMDASLGYKALAFAVANGAQVVSLSWGSYLASKEDYRVIKECYDNGVIVIAAAGNIFSTLPHYPAAYGEMTTGHPEWELPNRNLVVSVASIDEDNSHSFWQADGVYPGGSGFGPWVDIASYGTDIYSTVSDFDNNQHLIPNHYGLNTGTSMATPLVAGVAGLMRSFAPNATIDEIISCLINSANADIYSSAHPVNIPGTLGRGRLNALFALQCIQPNCENPFPFISASSTIVCPNKSVSLTASDGQSYLWSTNETTQSISISNAGTYYVTVDYGSCQGTASIHIDDISNLPFINVTENSGAEPNDGILCEGFAVVTAMWGSSYIWSNGQETQTTNILPNLPQSNILTCTVSDVGGCKGVDRIVQQKLVWLPLPVIEISYGESSGVSNDGTICANADIRVNASGGEYYSWNTGATTSYINVHPLVSTAYTVTVTNAEGCTTIKTAFVFVTSNCMPSCSCISSSDDVGTNNQSVTSVDDLFPNVPDNAYAIWPSHCLHIQGKLVVDHPFWLDDVLVIMDEGASIEIKGDKTLYFNNSFARGCERMWKGIIIEGQGQILSKSSIIEDAEYAIRVQNKGTFYLIGNSFRNNYVSIYLNNEGPGNPSVGLYTTPLRSNIFSSHGNIKEPYYGHPYYPFWPVSSPENPTNRPFAGIIDNGVFGLKYDPDLLYRNRFENLRNGIILNNVTQTIQNVEIVDIVGSSSFNFPSGIGVWITGGFEPVVTNSTIQNMHVGIWADGARDININHTIFQNFVSINNAPATALLIDNHIGASIKYNKIINAGTGIQMNRNNVGGVRDFIIQDNYIQLTSNSRNFRGIDLNFIGDGNYKGLIDDNFIQIKANSSTGAGIRSSNCTDLIISNNNVIFEVPVEFGWGRGIDLMNVRKSRIHHNALASTVSVAQSINRSGIHAENAFNNMYFCNTIYGLDKGLNFSYICDFTKLNSTTLGSNQYGLYLKDPTTLTPQVDAGNVWQGTYTYQGIIDGTDNNSILLTAQNSAFYANPSQNSLGHIYFPTNLFPTIVLGTWFIPNNRFVPTCPGIFDPDGGGDYTDDNIAKIARSKFNTGVYKNILNWIDHRFLFNLLKDSSQFTSLHTAIDSFYVANLTSTVGNLDSIDRALYRNETNYEDIIEINALTDRCELFLDSIDWLKTEFGLLQLDSATYITQRSELEDSLFYMLHKIDSLYKIGYAIAKDHLEDMESLNSNVYTQTVFESDQKQMNDILLRAWQSGLDDLTGSDWDLVEEYAFSCPLVSGLAVYQAQSLLNLIIDTIYPETICDMINERSLDEHTIKHEELVSAIYPNPSNNGWNVVSLSEEFLSYVLTDIHGNIKQAGIFQKGINNIDDENTGGIYILHVKGESHRSNVYKLISIH